MTIDETVAIDRWLADAHPELVPVAPTGSRWRSWGRGGLVLPQDEGTDGMAVFRYRRSGADGTGRPTGQWPAAGRRPVGE